MMTTLKRTQNAWQRLADQIQRENQRCQILQENTFCTEEFVDKYDIFYDNI